MTWFRSWPQAKQDAATDEVCELVEPQNLAAVCASFPSSTSIGSDEVPFWWMDDFTLQEWEIVSRAFKQFISQLGLPMWMLHTQLFSLAKKGGLEAGARVIGVLTSMCRLFMRAIVSALRVWDVKMAVPGDSAVQGASGTEVTGYIRSINHEVLLQLGLHVGLVLLDITKFYDNVKPHMVVDAVQEEEFPVLHGIFALQVHGAPRVIALHDEFSEIVQDFDGSIIAGCATSTSICRAVLLGPYKKASKVVQSAHHALHVDDWAVQISSRNRSTAIRLTHHTKLVWLWQRPLVIWALRLAVSPMCLRRIEECPRSCRPCSNTMASQSRLLHMLRPSALNAISP